MRCANAGSAECTVNGRWQALRDFLANDGPVMMAAGYAGQALGNEFMQEAARGEVESLGGPGQSGTRSGNAARSRSSSSPKA